MQPRFQADNDLSNYIRLGVLRREPSVDFRGPQEASLVGVDDPNVLRQCARDDRILVSHDENTMPAAFRAFLRGGNHSPGLLLVPQEAPIASVIESILVIWAASEADDWIDRVEWLPI